MAGRAAEDGSGTAASASLVADVNEWLGFSPAQQQVLWPLGGINKQMEDLSPFLSITAFQKKKNLNYLKDYLKNFKVV